jgi:hypothetical protein
MSMPRYDDYLKTVGEIEQANRLDRISNNEPPLNQDDKKLEEYMIDSRTKLIGDRWIFDAYSPVLMFNKSKSDIEHNVLFEKIFSKMPAGGNLHIHTSSIWNSAEFIKHLISLPEVYIYWDPFQGSNEKYKHGAFSTLL